MISSKILSSLYRSSSVFLSFLLLFNASSVNADWENPPNEFETNFGVYGDIGSDANGHAWAVYDSVNDEIVYASYYTGSFWTGGQIIIPPPFGVSSLDIDMEDTGTALVVAYKSFNGTIVSAHYNGSVWSNPPVTTITPAISSSPTVSMNGSNSGLSVWADSTTGIIGSAFFSGLSWTVVPVAIGQVGTDYAAVAYSANGTAVAIWGDPASSLLASNYIGGVWQAPVVLAANTSNFSVGIDDNGNAIVVWSDINDGNILTRRFNGVWQPAQILSSAPGNQNPVLGVAPGGTAVAAWLDGSLAGQSRAFDGTTWGPQLQFTAGPIDPGVNNVLNSISVDSNGNALAIWATFTNDPEVATQVISARLTLGAAAWCPEDVVNEDAGGFDNQVFALSSSLSENGIGFAMWAPASEGVTYFGAASLSLAPATNVAVRSCVNRFATQVDRSYIITWAASTEPTILYYEVRRNGILVATIPSDGPFVYAIHNLCKGEVVTDVYTITAFGCGNEQSVPVTVVFP